MLGTRSSRVRKSIGANVSRLRSELGLTQEQLGEKAKIQPRHLQDIERGRTNITINTLVALATALDVGEPDLLAPARLLPATKGRPPKKKYE